VAELLTERLAVIARDHARREALVDGDERFSYAQLWVAANAFAGFLANLGLTRGARVAVILPNGSTAVAAVYGTWLAGGVVVPLNARRELATSAIVAAL
jgi:acyl-CoA synthetase (AMP-forming)/AMP-acid ligase II